MIAGFIQRDQQPKNRSWKAVEQILRHDLADWDRAPAPDDHQARRDRGAGPGDRPRQADHGEPAARAHQAPVQLGDRARSDRDLAGRTRSKPPSPKVERERVLTDPELRAVWQGCDRLGWPFGPLVQLMMLTGAAGGRGRGDALGGSRPRGRDLDAGQLADQGWPGAPGAAVERCDRGSWRRSPGSADFVFPGRRTDGARPVCGFSKAKVRLDRLCGVSGWVFHDLRRTAAPPWLSSGCRRTWSRRSSTTAAPGSPVRWAGSISATTTWTSAAKPSSCGPQTLMRIVATGSRGEVVPLRA